MAIVDDLRKTLTDPTPLYAVAGTVDLTAEKLREVPALIEKLRVETPDRIAATRVADRKAVQERVAVRAKELQAKFNEVVASIDVKQFRDNAQDFALQQLGRAAEAAVKARETYDDLAERGRVAVNNLRGEAAEQIEEAAVAIEPSTPKAGTANGTAGAAANGTVTESKAAEAKAAGRVEESGTTETGTSDAKSAVVRKNPAKKAATPKKITPSDSPE